jgi:hypothetical protein
MFAPLTPIVCFFFVVLVSAFLSLASFCLKEDYLVVGAARF